MTPIFCWNTLISHSYSITTQSKDQQRLIEDLQNELKNVNGQTEGQKVLISQMKTKAGFRLADIQRAPILLADSITHSASI